MEHELDSFDFILAEKLGMTLKVMRETMPNNEYHQWRAFYVYRDAMEDLERRKQEGKKRGR